MKKISYLFAGLCFLSSCNNEKAADNNKTTAASETAAPSSSPEKVKPVFSYPIRYSDWEIGNPGNIKTVLDLYYAWDHKLEDKVSGLFADMVTLRIPTERNEITIPNNKISEKLKENRAMYDSTSNSILSAVSLHDRESNEDWVMITTYNKWTEKDGKRDSVLYHDDWRLSNGKINMLMSYYKLPSKTFLKKNDAK